MSAIRSLCIKLAYELCCDTSELVNEYLQVLEIMEEMMLPTSLKTVRENVVKELKKRKKLFEKHLSS